MSYGERVWNYLIDNGSITAKEITEITGTTCPHSVIRSIRKKYGADVLDFKDIKKTKIIMEYGEPVKKQMVYREWFLKKLA